MLAEALAVLAALAPGSNAIDACLAAAERRFNLPQGVATAIARVESGLNPAAINRANRNGTYDLGLMQINSIHQPRLLRDYGIARVHLYNPCVSAFAGGQVLAKALARTGGAIVPALSMYNTGRPDSSVGLQYAARVLARWNGGGPAAQAQAALPPAIEVIRPERSPLFVVASASFGAGGGFTPRGFQ